jgi:hypothetical protein
MNTASSRSYASMMKRIERPVFPGPNVFAGQKLSFGTGLFLNILRACTLIMMFDERSSTQQ